MAVRGFITFIVVVKPNVLLYRGGALSDLTLPVRNKLTYILRSLTVV